MPCPMINRCPMANKFAECQNGNYRNCAVYDVVRRWPPSAQIKNRQSCGSVEGGVISPWKAFG